MQLTINQSYITLNNWLFDSNQSQPDLNNIIKQIAFSSKLISNKIRRAGLENLYGNTLITNFHGDEVKKLDIVTNNIFIDSLRRCDISTMISEEENDLIPNKKNGKYVVAFDPLDGSSNIDVNITIGSIFGIYNANSIKTKNNTFRTGREQICAGYTLYSSSMMLILALNNEVNCFTFDEVCSEFVLTTPNIKIGKQQIYSINTGFYNNFHDETKQLVKHFEQYNYPLRYVGSMVADIHRTLLYGGIFINPSSEIRPNGKLRYYYEVAPISLIIEMAGGAANLGNTFDYKAALDYEPQGIHDRVPIYCGNIKCVDLVNKFKKIE